MKKALITIVILAAIGVGGYVWYIGNMAEDEAVPEAAVETPDDAVEAVEEVIDEAEEAADEAVEAVEEAVEDAGEAVEGAIGEATEGAADVAEDAAEAAEEAAADAAVEETATTPPTDVLSPEGFDADAVIGMIDDSSLDDAQKESLKAAVETARNVPDMLGAVLDQVRTALGM
ncbi:hypothetical protein [Rhodovulum steppense]|uniref:Translation initiation factor 3 n=1 Tax=Rhodovulum steppense TaxID=540251 RepID=A0A4R1YPJ1_9RHOB|nr:hypothetical protein [Rhodovulum steppense]TCM80539.1 hypothetical protein EV216_12052 [Rhodovulum steppense]